ncbi:MAG: AMP-binding protein [Spirochaetaceae bacterium]|nr:AMP-binding protein [Spirochaetaceae bacterium]
MDRSLPALVQRIAREHPDVPAQYYKDEEGNFLPILFKDYFDNALSFGAGLLSLGVRRGDHIGLIADNRWEWNQADMGLMAIGGIDVPRGCDATEKDLAYILSFAECKTVIVENGAQMQKILRLKGDLPLLKHFIAFDPPSKEEAETAVREGFNVYTRTDIMEFGKKYRSENPGAVEEELEKVQWDDLACIIFTSGTTGEPKGVMLSHGNFLTQLDELPERIILYPGDRAICVLPVWHAFQRLCEYVILSSASAICYSKPVGSVLLADIQKLNPQLLPAVPRVFEAVYEGIFRTMRKTGGIVHMLFTFFVHVAILQSRIERVLTHRGARFKKDNAFVNWLLLCIPWLLLTPLKALGGAIVFKKIRIKLGNAFRGGVSGGGALPPQVDDFFWAIGVNVVEGYGLTETAPVVSVRPFTSPVFGTVGTPLRGVEVKVMDEEGNVLPPGKKGTLYVKGGLVMKGYYRKPELTAKVVTPDGWLNTGDIAMLTIDNEIVLKGRIKDTIVLRGGENVEPLPLEMKLNESQYISQSVVLGQDERYLGVLIVPSKEEVLAYAEENGILADAVRADNWELLLKNSEIQKLFDTEIKNLINQKNGFKLFERINRFALLSKPFEVGIELSAKQEVMRYRIPDIYIAEMKELFR